ncbi:MAG: hypothetical protein ACFFEJ_17265 [Candidatus Thorarchaeota archaeon]
MKTDDYANQSNEKMLFLYNKLTGMAPYTHEFVPGHLDSQMLSGFVSAMSSFMEEMTGAEQHQWKTVYGSDTILLVEASDWMVSVLAVVQETREYRSKLRRIVKEYEQAFAHLKNADGIEGGIFNEFDKYVQRVFVGDKLNERTLILKGDDCMELLTSMEGKPCSSEFNSFLTKVSDGQTIQEYIIESDSDSTLVKELISEAVWRNLLYLHFIPMDNDIMELSTGSSSIIFSSENPLQIPHQSLEVITALDGRKPLLQFIGGLSTSKNERLIIDLGNLCNLGYLSRVPIEQKFLLLNECILTRFYLKMKDALDEETVTSLFTDVRSKVIKAHSWAGRINLEGDGRIKTYFESTATPHDLEMISDALDAHLLESVTACSEKLGLTEVKRILHECTNACNNDWRDFFDDVLL